MNIILKLLLPLALIALIGRFIYRKIVAAGGLLGSAGSWAGGKIAGAHEATMQAIERRAGAYGQRRGEAAAGQRFSEIKSNAQIEKAINDLEAILGGNLTGVKRRNATVILSKRGDNRIKALQLAQLFGDRDYAKNIADYLARYSI